MSEQQRTKLLACILLVVLAFMALRPDRRLFQPIQDAKNGYMSAKSSFEGADLKHMQVLVARNRIEQCQAISLPPTVTDAQRLYLSWVTNLAEQCNFGQLEVSPGSTEPARDQFLTVNVNVKAETDLDGLSRFLYLFDSADLMHRIALMEIESDSTDADATMTVSLTAQGISVTGSPDHSEVFPRSGLETAIDDATTELTVSASDGFPDTVPFLAQVDGEMIRVTQITEQRWTIERGVEGTEAKDHDADENVQMFPIAFARKAIKYSDYEQLLASSPFSKPTPPREYRPSLGSINSKTIAPGETVSMTARAKDMNEKLGEAQFSLQDAAEGMAIDAKSGKFTWEPSRELPPEKYMATVVLTQEDNPELRVEKKITITIQLPNDEPKLTIPEKANIVVQGKEFRLQLSAEDDGSQDSLKFSAEGTVPEGLTIEESTGVLTWTPAKTVAIGDHEVTVKVTDGGKPEKSASAKLALKVVNDDASLTHFTGAVSVEGVSTAYFRNHSTNAKPVLKVGDRLTFSEIDAEITEISKRHILLADAEGVWELKLGNNLRQRELVEPADKTEKQKANDESSQDASENEEAPAEKPADR